MPWRIEVDPRARRDLRAVPPRDRAAIGTAIDRLGADFAGLDLAKLAGGGNRWRLRVGRWRVLLELDNESGTILVSRVVAHKDAYR